MNPLQKLLRDGASSLAIESHLDHLSPAARKKQVLGLSRTDQVKLYERSSPVIDLEHFVPNGEELTPVRHHGMNNQPAFRRFAKSFTRGEDGTILGYNEGVLEPVIGPGYFVARETGGDDRGHVVVDYFMTPSGAVPRGWPSIQPNSQGLQRFVFDRCRDYMRRSSKHVSVGKAYKEESQVMGYFVLVRED